MEDLEKLIAANPKDPRYRYELGLAYERQGFLSLAHDVYQAALACPAPPIDMYKHLAEVDLRLHKYDEATSVINSAVKKCPGDYSVLLTAGHVMQNQRRYADARVMYEKARDLRPDDPDVYAVLADLYNSQGQFKKAVECADRSLKLRPDFDLANYEKAKAMVSLGLFHESLEPLEKTFRQNPLSYANNKLYAQMLAQQKRPTEALKPILALLAVTGGTELASWKSGAGGIISGLGADRVRPQIEEVEAAICRTGHKEQAARVHFALGDVFDKMKQPDRAMAQYERGLSLDPTFARGYLRLAEDLETHRHDLPKALANYEKAYSLNKDDPEIVQRLKNATAEINKRRLNPLLWVWDWIQQLLPAR